MDQKPMERLWGLVDLLLTEQHRQQPPEQLTRMRVLVGAALFLLVLTGLFLLNIPNSPPEQRPQLTVLGYLSLVGYAAVLPLARWRTSPTAPALLLCSWLTGSYILATLHSSAAGVVTHATTLLIPVLAAYLLGMRLGSVFTAIFTLYMAFFHKLYQLGMEQLLASPLSAWLDSLMAAVTLPTVWVLGWLQVEARQQAHAALERALRTLRESEAQLVSLIESTEDLVVSVDTQGRLIRFNSATRQFYQRLSQRTLERGEPLFPPDSPELHALWQQRFAQALAGQRLRVEDSLSAPGHPITLETIINPIHGEEGQVVGLTLFGRDITERKEHERRLAEMHRSLLDVSRQAGMAEVATGVLHNVGNTLNGINVSAGLVVERLRGSRLGGLARVVELLEGNASRMSAFLTEDERGRQLPAYLVALSRQLLQERESLLGELGSLTASVEHIKAVVSMQQAHARYTGVLEQVPVPQLIDDALRLHALSFERLGIHVRREYAELPPVVVDRHRLLQILLNLLSNARHALLDSGQQEKQLAIRVGQREGRRWWIEVADNGVGIAPEHLARLFTQGFTTKAAGHGFGLHISVLAAQEMGGTLSATSPGRGQGATFTLELPLVMQVAAA